MQSGYASIQIRFVFGTLTYQLITQEPYSLKEGTIYHLRLLYIPFKSNYYNLFYKRKLLLWVSTYLNIRFQVVLYQLYFNIVQRAFAHPIFRGLYSYSTKELRSIIMSTFLSKSLEVIIDLHLWTSISLIGLSSFQHIYIKGKSLYGSVFARRAY